MKQWQVQENADGRYSAVRTGRSGGRVRITFHSKLIAQWYANRLNAEKA